VAAVVALLAGAGVIAFALQRSDGTGTATSRDDIRQANTICEEFGREPTDDCAVRRDTTARPRDTADQPVEAVRQEVTVDKLQVGDCVNDLLYPDAVVVPCTAAHQGEVVAVLVAPKGPYPGEELLIDAFAPKCETEGAAYVGNDPILKERLYIAPEVPYATDWDVYGRTIICSAFPILKEPLEESVRASGE
jgi:Septum formation